MTSGAGRNILVVDDEHGYHDLFRFVLEPLGFTVLSAYEGTAGVARFHERDYSAVFLDVHMPGMTGLEALKTIRQAKPSQRVIIMSSGSDPRQVLEKAAVDLGAADCIFKPFELDQILKNVENIP
ncbi:MAG: response regulator [Elusimicrobiales bacterium]|jgi:CheY-like chemotaxis protein